MPEEPQLQLFRSRSLPATISLPPSLPLQKRRHLMPVPAHRHRTPFPSPRPRIIIKKQSAPRIRAPLHRCILSLHNQLRRRSRNRRQQPLQPALPSDKLQPPSPFSHNHLIVPFRNPQYLVDRRHPRLRKLPPLLHRRKHRPHTLPQTQNLQQHRIHRPRFAPLQRFQPHPALFANHLRIHQKIHKFRPRKIVRHRQQVGKIQGQPSGNQFWRCCVSFQSASLQSHLKVLTSLPSEAGYTLPVAHLQQFPALCRIY
jgi:hypothetical protein